MPRWPWSAKSSAKVHPLKPLPEFSLFNNENNNDANNANDSTEACKMLKKKIEYLDQKFKELHEELDRAKLFKKKGNTNEAIRSIEKRIEINKYLYSYYNSFRGMYCNNDFSSNSETLVRENASEQMDNVESHVDPVGWRRMKNKVNEDMRKLFPSGGKRTRKGRKARRSSSRKRT